MEHKLSKLKRLQHITLTNEERAYLRVRIAEAITRPQNAGLPLFQLGMQHGLRIALSSFLFVIFVGGSISAVASNALPGDPLYDVKTKVNERVKAAFLSTPEEKVAHQKSLVEKRVGEIKTLAASKTLTKERQAKAQKALDTNIANLSDELSTLSDESPNTALSVTANLEESLKADKQAIENAFTEGTESAAAIATIETIDGTLKKVSEQEVKIISKELEKISDELDATAIEGDPADPELVPDEPDVEGAYASTTTPDASTPLSP